jgi:uncharacterized membrane protein
MATVDFIKRYLKDKRYPKDEISVRSAIGMLESFPKVLKCKLTLFLERIEKGKYDYLATIAIICYGVVFSYFTLLKHYNFSSYAADLGVFVQSFYTTLFHGRLFYYTLELHLNPTGSYFGIHFSPILFILLPIYAVFPSAESLLVTQSFLLAIGGLPLYLISQRLLKSKKAAFVMVMLYLLYVPLHGANWFDFHPQAFIPVIVLFIYYFAITQSWKLYFVATLLGLMIQEHLVYIIFVMAIYFLITNCSKNILVFIKQRCPIKSMILDMLHNKGVLVSILTIMACFGWYLLISWVKSYFPINPLFSEIYRATSNFQVLGFNGDIITLPFYVIFNPEKTFNALMFDFYVKFIYVLILFGPLLFIPFRSKFCLVSFFVLGPILLTNYLPYYTVGAQYPLYLIPLIFISTVEGLSTLGKLKHSKIKKASSCGELVTSGVKARNALLRVMIVASLIFMVSTSPLSPLAYSFSEKGILWYPSYASITGISFADSLHTMLGLIPPNSSIITVNYIFPHIASRLDAYLVPFDFAGYQQEERKEFLKGQVTQILNNTEFILLNSMATDYWSNFVFQEILNTSFGIYATTYSFVLFKKDYKGEPILVPNGNYQVYKAYKDFVINVGQIITDATSDSGLVAFSQKEIDSGTFIYGPYICLPPGTYDIIFEIKISQPDQGLIAKLDIADNCGHVILIEKNLYSIEVQTEQWNNVTLQLSISNLRSALEFRIFTTGLADIYFDRVIIKKSRA